MQLKEVLDYEENCYKLGIFKIAKYVFSSLKRTSLEQFLP
jgi:hypothetical protein